MWIRTGASIRVHIDILSILRYFCRCCFAVVSILFRREQCLSCSKPRSSRKKPKAVMQCAVRHIFASTKYRAVGDGSHKGTGGSRRMNSRFTRIDVSDYHLLCIMQKENGIDKGNTTLLGTGECWSLPTEDLRSLHPTDLKTAACWVPMLVNYTR